MLPAKKSQDTFDKVYFSHYSKSVFIISDY